MDIHSISIRYKIIIPVTVILIVLTLFSSSVTIYNNHKQAKENFILLADTALKPIVLTSNVSVAGANIMKIKSRDMQTLYKASDALYIYIEGMSNKIPKSLFAPEQPPKKMVYTYETKAAKQVLATINKNLTTNGEKFEGEYLVIKRELKIKNKGSVTAIFDASILDEYLSNTIKETLFTALPLLIISVIVLFTMTNLIVKSIKEFQVGLIEFFKYLNRETTEVKPLEIKSKDEVGLMSTVVNENIQQIKNNIEHDQKMIQSISDVANKISNGHLSLRVEDSSNNLALEELKVVVNNMLDNLSKNLDEAMEILSQYAQLNYLDKVTSNGVEGSILKLIDDVNAVGDASTQMLLETKKNGLILEQDAKRLSTNVTQLSNSASSQAESLKETTRALNEITDNIKLNTQSSLKMATFGDKVKKSVVSGLNSANLTVESMNDINHQTAAITEAIIVIDQIAFQTNILSLNAAVEAATAGEAGKGFAVVAGEVRSLAARAAEAANEIKALVETAATKANDGKTIATDMIEGYAELENNINQTIELIEQVTNSSKEQEQNIIEINDAVNKIEQLTQENAKVASDTNIIALQTQDIAHLIVENTDKKQFSGQENIKIRKKPTNLAYEGVERRKVEKEISKH